MPCSCATGRTPTRSATRPTRRSRASSTSPRCRPVRAAYSPSAATDHLAHLRGTVTDRDGHPLSGTDVYVYSQSGRSRHVRTAANGSYAVDLAPGPSYVLAGGRGHGGNSDATGYVAAQKHVRVAAGETRKSVDFSLYRGGAITGKVTDRAGHPLAGVIVQPRPAG